MGHARVVSVALPLGAALAAVVLLVSIGPGGAGAGWRAYDAGSVAFSAPEVMRPPGIDQQSPEPFDPTEPAWSFTLTDKPAAPDRGLTVSFEWSSTESVASPTMRIIGRKALVVNDREATRIDWLNRDMRWRGLDMLVAGLSANGQVFKASCHAPEALWAKAGPTCEAIVATLQWRVAPAPVETAAEPLQSQPLSAATDESLIPAPPPSPVASSSPVAETSSSAVPSETPQSDTPPPRQSGRATLLWSEIAAGAVLVLAVAGLPRRAPPP